MRTIKLIIFTIALLSTCAFQLQASILHNLAAAGDVDGIKKLLAPSEQFFPLYCSLKLVSIFAGFSTPYLSSICPIDLYERDEHGYTALEVACQYNKTQVAQFLIAKGVNVNLRNFAGFTALHRACEYNSTEIAQLLITNGADINARSGGGGTIVGSGLGLTPLSLACKNNNTEVAKLLIANGAIFGLKDNNGNTALHVACENNHTQVAQLLIANGAAIDLKNNVGSTALHLACDNNNTQIIQDLITNATNLNLQDNNGNTALHFACGNNHMQAAQLLITAGANLNLKDSAGLTPLLLACKSDKTNIAQLLIAKGADLNIQDNNGLTALHYAYQNNNLVIMNLLIANGADVNLKNNAGDTMLLLACKDDNTNIAQLLIANGADLNVQDNNGLTALHYACQNNNLVIMNLLITKKANLNFKNNDGETVLLLACKNDNVAFAKLLIGGGADINLQDKYGNAPLNHAYTKNNLEIIKLLIQYKANLDLPTSILLLACFYNNTEIAKLLIEGGASLSLKDSDNSTALHYACMHNNTEVAKLLIEKGVNVNAKNKSEFTPLHYACENNNLEIIKSLVTHQANINIQNKDGCTPLHFAVEKNDMQAVRFFIKWNAQVDLKNNLNETPLLLSCSKGNIEIAIFLIQHGASFSRESMNIIHSHWTVEQIITLFDSIIPFKARKQDSARDKFLHSVLVDFATEFKNGKSDSPHLLKNNLLFNSKNVENPTAIIKIIDFFLLAFFSPKIPNFIMPRERLSEEENRVCNTICTTTPFKLAVERPFNLTPCQFCTLGKHLKFAQAAYMPYFNATNKTVNTNNNQEQLAPYQQRFHDVNIWFDKNLLNSFVRSKKTKPFAVLLDSFLKDYQESTVKEVLFEELLSTVQSYLKMDNSLAPEFQNFINNLPKPIVENSEPEEKSTLESKVLLGEFKKSDSLKSPVSEEFNQNGINFSKPSSAFESKDQGYESEKSKVEFDENISSKFFEFENNEDEGMFSKQQDQKDESDTAFDNIKVGPKALPAEFKRSDSSESLVPEELNPNDANFSEPSSEFKSKDQGQESENNEDERGLNSFESKPQDPKNESDPFFDKPKAESEESDFEKSSEPEINKQNDDLFDSLLTKFMSQTKNPSGTSMQLKKTNYADDIITCKSCIKDSQGKIKSIRSELDDINTPIDEISANKLNKDVCLVWKKLGITNAVVRERQKKLHNKMDMIRKTLLNNSSNCTMNKSLEDKLKQLQKRSVLLDGFMQSQLPNLMRACFITKNDIFDKRLLWQK